MKSKNMNDSMRYYLQLFIFYFFISNSSFGQILSTKQISNSNGLSNSDVRTIAQDKYGFMWIGTQDGLNRYDGVEFKIYKNIPGDSTSISGNEVFDTEFDESGNIWIATGLGVSYFDRFKNVFKQYDISNMIKNYSTSTPQSYEVFISKNGKVYIGSIGAGLLIFNPTTDSFDRIKYSDTTSVSNNNFDVVLSISENINGIYALSFREGLCRLNIETNLLENVEMQTDDPKVSFKNFKERGATLHSDANGIIWILTEYGIYKYNPKNDKLKTIKRFADDSKILNNLSNAITVDNEGNIWAAKDSKAIYKFDGISDDFEEIKFWESKDITGQNNEIINSMYFDKTGILWIGTFLSGIYLYDASREPFTNYTFDPSNSQSISGNEIFSIYESEYFPGKIYVGVRGAGFNVFDPLSKSFDRKNLKLKNDMFGGSVRAILENEDGSLYLGTWGAGLLKYQNGNYKIVAEFDSTKENSLSENRVRVLKKDEDGKLWVGTNGGLNIFDPSTNKVERIYDKNSRAYNDELIKFVKSKNQTSKNSKSILQVGDNENRKLTFQVERPREYLVINLGEGNGGNDTNKLADFGWITNAKQKLIWTSNYRQTYLAGGATKNRILLDIIKLTPGSYNLHYQSDDSHSFGKWNATPPADSLLWGIKLIELEDSESRIAHNLIQKTETQLVIEATSIRSIHISGDLIWIGSDQQGLNKYNKVTKELKVYSEDRTKPNSISNNSVQYIYEDKRGMLWLATNAGLNLFDPVTEKFTVYNQSDGLPSNYIASILEDDSGSLWISTRNGLSRMNIDEKNSRPSFVNYDSRDGLGGTDYIALVALKSSKGNLYFGGVHGLNEFSPNKMNNQPPNIVLTDIKISNKSITQMGSDTPIDGLIMEAKEINLNYSQNDLSFDFAAMHYSRSDKNQYAHFLEGFEKEWQYDNRRFAIYTNLDPGEYTFKVKGSNADGIWNYEGATIKIKINPPWWFTTWAYIGYGLILILGIFGVDRIQRKRLMTKMRERRRIEEAELRAETAELQARASEAERKVLESEFAQKKKELDEARDLQLSMLPRELPQLPNLDIAVYMKTATEVGGDYYDFHIGLDGSLTVVLGDATGHGMKAGTMVTTTKSLFNVLAPNPNIVETFHEMTRCLKLMQMEKLSMCMTMLKITGNQIQMSAAGMPPVFIYKREDQIIEEHVMKGMPLGTFNNFPYNLVKSELSQGDTILLMSDGFPELFNDKKEMYGYKRARNLFEELATESPEEIISKLKTAGSEWINDKDPDDDVTFVVIKVK